MSNASITLYHYPLCPFSRMVRLLTAEAGVKVRLVEERAWNPFFKEFFKPPERG